MVSVYMWRALLLQALEEEFARENREQQLFYAQGGEMLADHASRVSCDYHTSQEPPADSGRPHETAGSQHSSQKSQDDNSSGTKSSSGSLDN